MPVVFLSYGSNGCSDKGIDFLSNWRNIGTKSSLRKSDMCPGCPARLSNLVTADWLKAPVLFYTDGDRNSVVVLLSKSDSESPRSVLGIEPTRQM